MQPGSKGAEDSIWTEYFAIATSIDEAVVKDWGGDLDTMLIFVSAFSAARDG